MKRFPLMIAALAVPILLAIAGSKNSQNTGALTPVLGNYPDTSLALSTDTTDTPDASPMNTERINVSTSTDFKGTLEGNPVTGVVRVTDATGAQLAEAPLASAREVDAAVAAAGRAFDDWRFTPPTQRAKLLWRLHKPRTRLRPERRMAASCVGHTLGGPGWPAALLRLPSSAPLVAN